MTHSTPPHRLTHDLGAAFLLALFVALMVAVQLLVAVVLVYDLVVTITRL